MRFIRKGGQIIPIRESMNSGARAAVQDTAPKITISLKNQVARKLNGISNKFKTINPEKVQSAYNIAQGKHLGNTIGKTFTFGKTKQIFAQHAIKSESRLGKITKIMTKNKNARVRYGALALGSLALGGAYVYSKFKKRQENVNEIH